MDQLILHLLVAKEMNGKYGLPGYDAYLLPKAIEWYLGGVTPLEKEWILE